MRFDLNGDIATRFEMEGGGWVELRIPSAGDFLTIQKACTKKRPFAQKSEDGQERVYVADIVDEALQREMINDIVIAAWGDLFDKSGKPIPCTHEMKVRLWLMRDSTFRDFVNEKYALLLKAEGEQALMRKKQAEAAEANLSPGPPGP